MKKNTIVRLLQSHAQIIECYHFHRKLRRNMKSRKKSYSQIKLNAEVNIGISMIKCVESIDRGRCTGCFLDGLTVNKCHILVGACNGEVRSDRRDVIFVKTTFTIQEVVKLLEWIRGEFDLENKEWIHYSPSPESSEKVIEKFLNNYKQDRYE